MIKRFLFLFLIFYFLTLIQADFLIHFGAFNKGVNLVLIALFVIIVLSPPKQLPWECFLAGFFLDLFSNNIFGVSMLILFLLGFLVKKVLDNIKKTNILILLLLLMAFQGIYLIFRNSIYILMSYV